MQFYDLILKRKSIRVFQDKEVPNLSDALELAREAPSAGGIRGYEVFRIKEQFGNVRAPCYLVICTDPEKYAKYGVRGRELYSVQDATIYTAYLQLILEDIGYASCWVGAFREDRVHRHLQEIWAPATAMKPIAILAVGYA